MPEQLRFQQICWDRSRVYRNKCFVRARRRGVNRFRDQLFARAAFAADQHRRSRRRHLRHQVEERQHLFALADNIGKTRTLLQRPFQLNVLFTQFPRFHRLRNLRKQFIVGPRLGNKIQRAAFESGSRHVNRTVRGNQHDRQIRVAPSHFLQQFQPVAVRQTYIQQHQVKRPLS